METVTTEYDNLNNALHGLRNSTVAVIDDGHTLISSKLLQIVDGEFTIIITYLPKEEV